MRDAASDRDEESGHVSTLSNLLRQVEKSDPQLASDLAREVEALQGRRSFGLNFERHVPETVDLPGRPIRKGDKVRFLPEREAEFSSVDQRLWSITGITLDRGRPIASLMRIDMDSAAVTTTRPCEDLVVVAEFRDPIYPGLTSTGKVKRGGDKPFHTVINAENFHALQTLLFTHEGEVDAIYIDPPYNTGARDWKYNNDYVDGEDAYRHSKWLAFMERRLRLAKRLLNPNESVLIVTIDEKEYARLALLIQQVFAGCTIQMVSSVINPTGAIRANEFTRTNEFIYFVFVGSVALTPDVVTTVAGEEVRWNSLRRFEMSSARRGPQPRPDQFYPIYVDLDSGRIAAIGESIPPAVERTSVPDMDGCVTVWPMKPDGTEMIWGLTPATLRLRLDAGFVRVSRSEGSDGEPNFSISYLTSGKVASIARGDITIAGKRPDGSAIVERLDGLKRVMPTTQWQRESHSAQAYGTKLLTRFLPARRFPFPKSLYAVEDCLRMFVSSKPDATIVDFFAGSGTTSHAVMRLNRQDGGRRRSISVTNNEVSAEEQAKLRGRYLRPGDAEWEILGICDYITKPRIKAAVTGLTPDGGPVVGEYKFIDPFPMSEGFEENVEFFSMTYEAPRMVAHNRSFDAIAPLLWLKAGASGRRIEKVSDDFDVADTYGVLFDLDSSRDFLVALAVSEEVRMAFIVTDDERGYQMVCSELPAHVQPVRLYESYLTNFAINTGRE